MQVTEKWFWPESLTLIWDVYKNLRISNNRRNNKIHTYQYFVSLQVCTFMKRYCVACALHWKLHKRSILQKQWIGAAMVKTIIKTSVFSKCFLSNVNAFSATHPLADLWPILVQLQWNGQSRTGLRPYPRSCDHEFTALQVVQTGKKNKKNTTLL